MTVSCHQSVQPLLVTERLRLRMAKSADTELIINYFRDNEQHLARSRPSTVPDFHTERYWQKQIELNDADFQSDKALRLFVFDREEISVIGSVNFTAFLRGPAQFCYLGYGICTRHEGKGLMREAVSAGIAYVFDNLNMHRIMANYMPGNKRSGNVLKKLGFVEEGYAKNYLFLNGRWCDHIMTSLTNGNWSERLP